MGGPHDGASARRRHRTRLAIDELEFAIGIVAGPINKLGNGHARGGEFR